MLKYIRPQHGANFTHMDDFNPYIDEDPEEEIDEEFEPNDPEEEEKDSW